jgi:hypothetical protein
MSPVVSISVKAHMSAANVMPELKPTGRKK